MKEGRGGRNKTTNDFTKGAKLLNGRAREVKLRGKRRKRGKTRQARE